MSTERLRAKLTKAGYDENEVFEMDRSELLSTYAEYLLSPSIPESPEKAEGGMSAEELVLRRRKEERLQQELELKKQELEFQKQKEEKEEERRKEELQMQRDATAGRREEKTGI